jgi:hypothetical protein
LTAVRVHGRWIDQGGRIDNGVARRLPFIVRLPFGPFRKITKSRKRCR